MDVRAYMCGFNHVSVPVRTRVLPRFHPVLSATLSRPAMRVLHYLSEIVLSHGGVVRAVLDLCDALARRGHDVTLLTFDDRDAPPTWAHAAADGAPRRPASPRVVTLPWPRGPKPVRRFDAAALGRIDALVRESDAVHLHVPWENTNKQVGALCRRAGVPYILSIHGMLDDWAMRQGSLKKRAFLALGARTMLRRAGAVLCTAEAEREQARRVVRRASFEVLPLILDLSPFDRLPTREEARRAAAALGASSLPIAPNTPVLLFLSRLHPKKGLERLIDAMPLILARGLRPILLVAGSADPVTSPPGYEASLRKRAADAGISERVVFLGHVTGADKARLFRAATLTVLPTSQENWGFSLVESLACATPVLTTRGVDIWRELEAGHGALPSLPAPPPIPALAESIADALADPVRLASMGDAGRAWALRELDPKAIIARYESLYERRATPRPTD